MQPSKYTLQTCLCILDKAGAPIHHDLRDYIEDVIVPEPQIGTITSDMTAYQIMSMGYRRVSNKYKTVARIDRYDWLDVLAESMNKSPSRFYDKTGKLDGQWCDWYRRCISKDSHNIPQEIFAQIPSSDGDSIGFIDLSKLKVRCYLHLCYVLPDFVTDKHQYSLKGISYGS